MGFRIYCLGVGPALVSAEKCNTSFLVDQDGTLTLIDCSGNPAHEILRLGYSLESLDAILLSHRHPDHIYALPSLLHNLWLTKVPRITIGGTSQTLATARNLIDCFGLNDRRNAVSIDWKELSATSFGPLPGSSFGSFPVTHAGLDALGFSVNGVAFSCDAEADRKLETGIVASKATRLFVDCAGGLEGAPGHAGVRSIESLARSTGVKEIYLVHCNLEESEADSAFRILSDFHVELPRDGTVVEVN